MTKDRELKDQLKDWKKSQPAPPAPAKSAPHKPVLRAPPSKKTDEELFAEAVAGVDRDAVLKKYHEMAPPPPSAFEKKPKQSVEDKRADDEALFAQFVGDIGKKAKP